MKTELQLVSVDETDAHIDLANGAFKRLSMATFEARLACERITYADTNPLDEIRRAEASLDVARKHAEAWLHYCRLGKR